jgi:NADH-quinone oxidoreductase subunit E
MKPTLSDTTLAAIQREIAKYPDGHRQSAVMAALTLAQEERGWLSADTIREIASILEMPPMAVYEVASFYAMYRMEPAGRFVLTVCTNLPCALEGANEVGEYLKEKLGIGYGETTPDGLFTLQAGECMGACGDGPVALVNHRRLRCHLSHDEVDKMLAELREQARTEPGHA